MRQEVGVAFRESLDSGPAWQFKRLGAYADRVSGTINVRVSRANVIILILIAGLGLLSIGVGEWFVAPLYDDASSFVRVDPKPGWIETPIVIEPNRPIGIVGSGRVSTPRLQRRTGPRGDHPRQVGPDGANVPEQQIADWREENAFPAFALLGRVDRGPPFLVGAVAEVRTPGKLELKINCPLWDKTRAPGSGTVALPFLKRALTEQELANLRLVQGFFAVRTWILGTAPARAPHLPPTAAEISARYGEIR